MSAYYIGVFTQTAQETPEPAEVQALDAPTPADVFVQVAYVYLLRVVDKRHVTVKIPLVELPVAAILREFPEEEATPAAVEVSDA
jgi:hypothetical protein